MMIQDTVIAIMGQPGDTGTMVAYLDSPSTHPNAYDCCQLKLDPAVLPPLDTVGNITTYGTKVREALEFHPAICQDLESIFRTILPDRSTLRFLIKHPNADRLRWEALCAAPARFIAMSDTCVISRVTPAKIGSGLRPFIYPVRMAALLSAAGIKAEPELENIRRHVLKARANGLAIECTFYVGEQDLLDKVQGGIEKEDPQYDGIAIEPIPPTANEISQIIKSAKIQFLHFLCHGIERASVRGLSLASISDHDKNEMTGDAAAASIFLAADALSEAVALNTSIWMAVLNSCSGAAVTHQLHSMALNVAMNGCPYTIGMAEPIRTNDALMFSEAFYGELFDIVRTTLEGGGAVAAPLLLDLSRAVIPARRAIHCMCDKEPNSFGHWLLPLLYQRVQQPLFVQTVDEKMTKRIQEISRALKALPSDTPIDLRDQLVALLDKEPPVPPALRPDRYGKFGLP